jgi:hypothetical protein
MDGTYFNHIINIHNRKKQLPFLTYVDSSSTVLTTSDVKFKVAFTQQSGTVNKLSFYASKYTINGTWLGFSPMYTDLEVSKR